MKRPSTRLSLLAVLALLLSVCLLTLAGPALAGSPALWGAHEFNSRSVSFEMLSYTLATAQIASDDPWASGTLMFWWDGDLNGYWSLSNPDTGGTWTGTWVGVARGAQVRATLPGMGSGAYAGHSIDILAITASGLSPVIMKGDID